MSAESCPIRPARQDDLESIVKIWQDGILKAVPDKQLNFSESQSISHRAHFEWLIHQQNDSFRIFVAESESGDVIGFQALLPTRNNPFGRPLFAESMTYVQPGAPAGLGTRLMAHALWEAESSPLLYVIGFTRIENKAMEKICIKSNFIKLGTLPSTTKAPGASADYVWAYVVPNKTQTGPEPSPQVENPNLTALDLEIDKASEAFLQFPWEDQDHYAHWLAQTYFFVRHTPRFLGLLIGGFGPETEPHHQKALRNLQEERDHDRLLLNDLKSIGSGIENFKERPTTASLYQSQYYWIGYVNPKAHYGYALLLEGLAARAGGKAFQRLKLAHGDTSASFLYEHSELDQDHFPSAAKEFLALSEQEQSLVLQNAKQTCALYILMLEEIKSDLKSKSLHQS